ncbi:hypothetical protein CMO92_01090, partial [Candidatus Woesearchaeota archaeon]|nr:hypothetical protein [Candidatus Woesearchaeota archaeon]
GISALGTGIYLEQGVSPLFIVVAAFLIIIFRDAVGVRKSAGEHGEALNKIVNKLNLKISHLDEVVGHTFVEASGGLLIGIGLALIVYAL